MFGYPQEPAMHVALSSIKDFLLLDENFKYFDAIVYNVFTEDDLKLYTAHIGEYYGENQNNSKKIPGQDNSEKVSGL